MKTLGMIVEYNPFHNGHKYLIDTAKERTGADCVIAVMSGDFLQRGGPAFMSKYDRTHMALLNGVDLVFQLPVVFSTASSEYFAAAGVSILDKLNVDYMAFGCENDDYDALYSLANTLVHEPIEYCNELKKQLRLGYSYPHARNIALDKYTGNNNLSLLSPNNILGIEYLKALIRRNSSIEPILVKRIGEGYHSKNIDSLFCSASAIREAIYNMTSVTELNLPKNIEDIIYRKFTHSMPIETDDLSVIFNYKLLDLIAHNPDKISTYQDMNPAIAAKIINEYSTFTYLSTFINTLKTKNFTHTRISRALLHMLLEITSEDFDEYCKNDYCNYARILGFTSKGQEFLSQNKKLESIKFITKPANAKSTLTGLDLKMFNTDVFANSIFNQIEFEKFGAEFFHELTMQPLMLTD